MIPIAKLSEAFDRVEQVKRAYERLTGNRLYDSIHGDMWPLRDLHFTLREVIERMNFGRPLYPSIRGWEETNILMRWQQIFPDEPDFFLDK